MGLIKMKASDVVLMATLLSAAGVSEADAKHLFRRQQDRTNAYVRTMPEKKVKGERYRSNGWVGGQRGKKEHIDIVVKLPSGRSKTKYMATCRGKERDKYPGTYNMDCQVDFDLDGLADAYRNFLVSTKNTPSRRVKKGKKPFSTDPKRWKKINQNTYYGSPRQKRRIMQDRPTAWTPARRHYTNVYDLIKRCPRR